MSVPIIKMGNDVFQILPGLRKQFLCVSAAWFKMTRYEQDAPSDSSGSIPAGFIFDGE
jgi:hypothetical protein